MAKLGVFIDVCKFEGENERKKKPRHSRGAVGWSECEDGGKTAVYQTMPTQPRQSLGIVDWLFDVGFDGVAPDEVALAHEVQAVVGEVGAQAALLVGEQGIEVNPRHALTAGDLF